jgi:predicted anti-sigma-YlaC factor YlaD
VTDCQDHPLDCRKVHELLDDYLDDELKEVVLGELETHLEMCPDCTLHVDSVKKVIRLYREATEEKVPVDIQIRLRDVLARVRDETEEQGGSGD